MVIMDRATREDGRVNKHLRQAPTAVPINKDKIGRRILREGCLGEAREIAICSVGSKVFEEKRENPEEGKKLD